MFLEWFLRTFRMSPLVLITQDVYVPLSVEHLQGIFVPAVAGRNDVLPKS